SKREPVHPELIMAQPGGKHGLGGFIWSRHTLALLLLKTALQHSSLNTVLENTCSQQNLFKTGPVKMPGVTTTTGREGGGAETGEQLEKKGKDCMASSLAVDESSDIRGDSSLNVTEEFRRYVLCTAQPQDRICMKRSGLVAKIREKMQEENVTAELTAHHCILHLESLCAEALNMEHGMFTITHAGNFIRAKGLIQHQFKAFLSQWQTQRGDLPHHTEASLCARVMGFEHVMTPVVQIRNSIRSRAKQLRTFKVLTHRRSAGLSKHHESPENMHKPRPQYPIKQNRGRGAGPAGGLAHPEQEAAGPDRVQQNPTQRRRQGHLLRNTPPSPQHRDKEPMIGGRGQDGEREWPREDGEGPKGKGEVEVGPHELAPHLFVDHLFAKGSVSPAPGSMAPSALVPNGSSSSRVH
ncbi:hypothetical protein D4764_05G0013120, partial [Takifugu flavidus]